MYPVLQLDLLHDADRLSHHEYRKVSPLPHSASLRKTSSLWPRRKPQQQHRIGSVIGEQHATFTVISSRQRHTAPPIQPVTPGKGLQCVEIEPRFEEPCQ